MLVESATSMQRAVCLFAGIVGFCGYSLEKDSFAPFLCGSAPKASPAPNALVGGQASGELVSL